jgi:hypothetical protein
MLMHFDIYLPTSQKSIKTVADGASQDVNSAASVRREA